MPRTKRPSRLFRWTSALIIFGCAPICAWPELAEPALAKSVEVAIGAVKPALVRIQVVEADYREGREVKRESFGSGVVIDPQGHVVTNHHVAGHATRLLCTFADRSEVEAELLGSDPLTDIAVLQLKSSDNKQFAAAGFGDSSRLQVGDPVLAMGSPLALLQSVTLGIVSNTAMTMPPEYGRSSLVQDGEDVGALVLWIGHDAPIYGGNSGGPLVNLAGEIIGINEIRMGLGGAIPSALVEEVAGALIAEGKVRRSWLGVEIQPRLKNSPVDAGVLISGTWKGSPAEKAGFQSGDILLKIAGSNVDVRFPEELPALNRTIANIPVGSEVEAMVWRNGTEQTLTVTTDEREAARPKEQELKLWGLTVRDISYMMATELKRDRRDGVLVTSVSPGGPAGGAKPEIYSGDILIEVAGKPIQNVKELEAVTKKTLEGRTAPTPTLTGFERKGARYITVVEVGIKELLEPGLEVKRAWLPVETQVITRDIAKELGRAGLKGFRVTKVYPESTASKAGLQEGDYITAVDDEPLTASAPEHFEELPTLIRQYPVGGTAELSVLRNGEEHRVPVELIRAPKDRREMREYREEDFEFTARNISFFDKADEKWPMDQAGALVEVVKTGGWAALGRLNVGDLIIEVNGRRTLDVESLEVIMDEVKAAQPDAVVMKVLRGIHTLFLEIEPKWRGKT